LGIIERSSCLLSAGFEPTGTMQADCVFPMKVSDLELRSYWRINSRAPSEPTSLPVTCGGGCGREGALFSWAPRANAVSAIGNAQARSLIWAIKADLLHRAEFGIVPCPHTIVLDSSKRQGNAGLRCLGESALRSGKDGAVEPPPHPVEFLRLRLPGADVVEADRARNRRTGQICTARTTCHRRRVRP